MTFSVSNNSTLYALVPSGVATGPVAVTTPGGTTNSGALWFYGTPSLFSFTPAGGLAGSNVVISGFNLLGTTNVLFDGAPASSFKVINNSTISAFVPTDASSGPITISTPAGTAVSPTSFAIESSALSLTVSATPAVVAADGDITYVITVTNSGPYAAFNATLADNLPSLPRLVSTHTTVGTFASNTNLGTLSCLFGDLPAGGSATVTLVDEAPAISGLVTNIASVTAGNNLSTLGTVITNVTYVQSLPLLSIQLIPDNLVELTWAPDLTNYQLQFKIDPTTNVPPWSNVSSLSVISNLGAGSRSLVIDTNSGGDRFYRLQR